MLTNEYPGDHDHNTIRFLVTTDNHLGYMDNDKIRKNDSFLAFEECLAHGRITTNADAVLLGGDLFHDNKPSLSTLNTSMALFRRYCWGSKDVEIEILSDADAAFRNTKIDDRYQVNGLANFQDPNINVAMPVFIIHGNHDDPNANISSIDLLQTSGLVNYFGRVEHIDDITLTPILMRKGNTHIALYGMGNVRDERLNRAFRDGKIQFRRPKEAPGAPPYFAILLLHQNRGFRTADSKNGIEEKYLKNCGIDLVIWGNEHDQVIGPVRAADSTFDIIQPGSTIHTGLPHGENGTPPKACCTVDIQTCFENGRWVPKHRVKPWYLQKVRPVSTKFITLHELRFVPHNNAEIRKYKDKIKSLKDNNCSDQHTKKLFSYGEILEPRGRFESEEEMDNFRALWARAKILEKKKEDVEELLRVVAHNLSIQTRLDHARRFFLEKQQLVERCRRNNNNNNNNNNQFLLNTNNTINHDTPEKIRVYQTYFEKFEEQQQQANNDGADDFMTQDEYILDFAAQYDELALPLLRISVDFSAETEDEVSYPEIALLRLGGDFVNRAANAGDVFKRISEREKALQRLKREKFNRQQQQNFFENANNNNNNNGEGGGGDDTALIAGADVFNSGIRNNNSLIMAINQQNNVDTGDIRSKIAQFMNQNAKDQCVILPEYRLSEAVYQFAEKSEKDAIGKTIEDLRKGTEGSVWSKYKMSVASTRLAPKVTIYKDKNGTVQNTIALDEDEVPSNALDQEQEPDYNYAKEITGDMVRKFAMDFKKRENDESRALNQGFTSSDEQKKYEQQRRTLLLQQQQQQQQNNNNNLDDGELTAATNDYQNNNNNNNARTFRSAKDEILAAAQRAKNLQQDLQQQQQQQNNSGVIEGNFNRRGRNENDDDDDNENQNQNPNFQNVMNRFTNTSSNSIQPTVAAAPKPGGKGSRGGATKSATTTTTTTTSRATTQRSNNNNNKSTTGNNGGIDTAPAQQRQGGRGGGGLDDW